MSGGGGDGTWLLVLMLFAGIGYILWIEGILLSLLYVVLFCILCHFVCKKITNNWKDWKNAKQSRSN